jgi:CreA protein
MERSIFKITMIIVIVCTCFIAWSFTNAEAKDVNLTNIGKVKCVDRMIQGDDYIQLLRFTDPDNPFVAIFFTKIDSGQFMKLANPSNTAIAARLIAPVPVVDGVMQINTTYKANVVSLPQSVFSKKMKIARMYDKKMNTLCYIVYTTKWMDGSLKHSLSVVPLGMPLNK